MLVTEERPNRQLEDFRRTLNRLMVNHGVYDWQELRQALYDVGYDIGQSRLSQYLNRKRNPTNPTEFFTALSDALELSQDEERELAHSFAYSGGRGRLVQENFDKSQDFEDKMRGAMEDQGEDPNGDEDRRV